MSNEYKFTSDEEGRDANNGYFLVQNEYGALHCSCGRDLEKLEDGSYKCAGGWPIYRPSDGDVIKDKFGNISLRMIPHGDINA